MQTDGVDIVNGQNECGKYHGLDFGRGRGDETIWMMTCTAYMGCANCTEATQSSMWVVLQCAKHQASQFASTLVEMESTKQTIRASKAVCKQIVHAIWTGFLVMADPWFALVLVHIYMYRHHAQHGQTHQLCSWQWGQQWTGTRNDICHPLTSCKHQYMLAFHCGKLKQSLTLRWQRNKF